MNIYDNAVDLTPTAVQDTPVRERVSWLSFRARFAVVVFMTLATAATVVMARPLLRGEATEPCWGRAYAVGAVAFLAVMTTVELVTLFVEWRRFEQDD